MTIEQHELDVRRLQEAIFNLVLGKYLASSTIDRHGSGGTGEQFCCLMQHIYAKVRQCGSTEQTHKIIVRQTSSRLFPGSEALDWT